MVFTGVVGIAALAYGDTFSADGVKAAYLFRFASYVEWPEQSKTDDPFVIGVVDADRLADRLERLLPEMQVRGRAASVRRITRAGQLKGVHILYVSSRSFRHTRALRAAAIKRPILIVTDVRNGLDGGAVINFIEDENDVRFEISLIAADRCGLKIDASLLSVATRVERRPEKS
jgi:hypothetical protein